MPVMYGVDLVVSFPPTFHEIHDMSKRVEVKVAFLGN